mgnify:CR=1 FL=1
MEDFNEKKNRKFYNKKNIFTICFLTFSLESRRVLKPIKLTSNKKMLKFRKNSSKNI